MQKPPKVTPMLSLRLPPDVAELLHRTAYETARSKREIVIEGIRLACKRSAS